MKPKPSKPLHVSVSLDDEHKRAVRVVLSKLVQSSDPMERLPSQRTAILHAIKFAAEAMGG
mgnify:CR=1 FL=1